MKKHGLKWSFFGDIPLKKDNNAVLGSRCVVECYNDFRYCSFNGKEKDYESGFHYYGARYYWSEVLTGWLSVDPMADKYPSISPYAYCVWNPVKLVDPDGRDTFYIELNQGKIYRQEAVGDHCIRFRKDGNILDERTISGIKSQLEYEPNVRWEDEELGSGSTDYLKFDDVNLGKSVFDMIEKECVNSSSAKEWDYYFLQLGGELSSSRRNDAIGHDPQRYTKENVLKWHHFHPTNSDQSWFPSYPDQERSRTLNVPSYLHNGGKCWRFDPYVRDHNLTPHDYRRKVGVY
jgi:RHS repeat-associated protein